MPRLHERFFDDTGLRVGSIEHRKPAKIFPTRFQITDLLANPGRFFAFVARAIQPNQFSRPLLRPKRLILSVGIKRDDLVRRIQNVSRRAVVLLQLDNPCIRKILFKIENVANVRAAPAVNRLVVIADNTQISALRSQQTHKHILRIVRILILIDMDIADFALIGFQHRRMLGKKFQRLNDQIVKVQRIGAFQLFFISVVNIINQLAAIIPFALGEPILRAEQFVFASEILLLISLGGRNLSSMFSFLRISFSALIWSSSS